MKVSQILKELSEGMATGGDVENNSLEIEDPTSTKPEKGKTVKVLEPQPKTELGKSISDTKKEINKDKQKQQQQKPADFTMLNKGFQELAKGNLADNTSLTKELQKIKDHYKSINDVKSLEVLNKVDFNDIQALDKLKINFKKTGDFFKALIDGV